MREQTVCFTGHRILPQKDIGLIRERLENVLRKLIEEGVIFYGSGGAIGFDALASKVVLDLKNDYPQIKLVMVLPCCNQGRKWSKEQREEYAIILSEADKVVYTSEYYFDGCMLVRNRHLVNNSGICVAYLTKNSGGTFFTVNLAKRRGLKIINIAEM